MTPLLSDIAIQRELGTLPGWARRGTTLTKTFTPQDGGTLLQKQVTTNTSPVMMFIAAPAIKKDAMTSLRNLKAKVESGE